MPTGLGSTRRPACAPRAIIHTSFRPNDANPQCNALPTFSAQPVRLLAVSQRGELLFFSANFISYPWRSIGAPRMS